MIPITIGFIGGANERSIKTGWVLSSFYVFGMAAVYAALGLVASLSGKIFGSLTNTPGWYLFIAAIMALCSLWMFDIIKFDPNVWLARHRRRRQHAKPHPGQKSPAEATRQNPPAEATVLEAFLLGATSGFIAAPCTTPILTTILSYIATQKSIVFGTLLMYFFAIGMGTVLVIIGTFTGAVKLLPKSGRWLQIVKICSGLLILALSGYFLYKAGTLR
jgi:thiol:disulfide interchange protein DsbD